MSAPDTGTAGQVAAAWRAAAARNDVAFAEYVSGLRYPAHLCRLVRFAHAHSPGACGVLLPRGHAKTTAAIHLVARLIGERRGRVKVIIATATEADALKRSTAIRGLVASPRFAQVFGWGATAWQANAGLRPHGRCGAPRLMSRRTPRCAPGRS